MEKKTKFGLQFIKNYKQIGSVTPSSPFLTKKMLKSIPFGKIKCLVEFGPGTGVFTKKILEQLNKDAKLICIELNTSLYEGLAKQFNDPRLILIHGSATDLPKFLAENNIAEVDTIISSLPLAAFPVELKKEMIQTAHDCLKSKGRYIQFQYTLNAKNDLESVFNKVNIDFTPFNIPPAFIYRCRKA